MAGLFSFNVLIAGPEVASGPSDYAPAHLTIGVGLYHDPFWIFGV